MANYTTYYLDAYLEAINDPPMLREAKALLAKARNTPITWQGSYITGCWTYEPFDFTYAGTHCANDLPDDTDPEEVTIYKDKVAQVSKVANGSFIFATFNDLERDAHAEGLVRSTCFGGHMTFDHRRLLKIGLPGIESEIEAASLIHAGDLGKDTFFDAMRLTLEAVRAWIRRHSEEAEQLAAVSSGDERDRMLRIAQNCRFITEQPPRTFAQALQLLWFLHIMNDYDSFGRFDWALQEYYLKDIADGEISREEAAVMLEDIWPRIPPIENMTIGGMNSDGSDSSTDLTLLILEVMARVCRPSPNLCLRTNSGTPGQIWDAAVRCIGMGVANPALYNDELIVPSLLELGIESADAWDYSLAGCSQVVIPGRCNFACDDGIFNAAKCFELALYDGIDPVSGKRLGPPTGAPESFETFDDLRVAFHKQAASAAKIYRDLLDKADIERGRFWGYALRTLLTSGCLINGKGIWDGGAKYNAIQGECIGITNAADSLTAVKKLVYDDCTMSMVDLLHHLETNWEGAEPARMRSLARLPKFGNDDDEADEVAEWVSRIIWEEIRSHHCSRGNGWMIPGGVIFVVHVPLGEKTGATPDGRRAGEPLADSSGPAQGRDRKGPTAVLRSVSKLPLHLAATCAVVNLKFGRKSFGDDIARGKMRDLFKSYFKMGGMQVQVTVVDKDELIDAQLHPENHRGLSVRVGGYSSYFSDLSRELQDDVISRTESV